LSGSCATRADNLFNGVQMVLADRLVFAMIRAPTIAHLPLLAVVMAMTVGPGNADVLPTCQPVRFHNYSE